MRRRKIRGYNRILRNVEYWKKTNSQLDLESLQANGRKYTKIWVPPYSNISLLNSTYTEPKGEVRKNITEGLLEINNQWKIQLDSLGQPYYLKIWLYDTRFSMSQVVCAIGPFLDFYNTTFYKPDEVKKINLDSFGSLKHTMESLNWEYALDEEHINDTYVGNIEEYETDKDFYETRRWYNRKLKNPYRLIKNDQPDSEIKEYYSFKCGNVWIAG